MPPRDGQCSAISSEREWPDYVAAMKVKFLHVNVDRTSTAHDLMEITAKEQDIDVLISAELNMEKTEINDERITDKYQLAAIEVRNLLFAVTGITRGIGYVTVTILKVGTVFSCYASPNITQLE